MNRSVRSSLSDKISQLVIDIIIILFTLTILVPCLYILALAFNEGKDAMRGGIWIWPRVWTLDNFKEVFKDSSFFNGFKISVARTVVGTLLHLIVTFTMSYAVVPKDLPGRGLVFKLLTFCMLTGVGTVPTYIVYHSYGLIDTFWVFILPGLMSITHLMMMRSFLEGIPDSLRESAQLDGCSYFGIMWRIMLPLSKPVIAVVALYSACGHWNDWFTGAFYTTSKKLWPAQTVLQMMLDRSKAMSELSLDQLENMSVEQLQNMVQNTVTSDSLKMAAVIVTTVPILVVYPFIQKYFAQGVMMGALKG